MLGEIPADEFAAAIDACAADVLWEAGVERPPVDAAVVAERIGLVIAQNNTMPIRGRFARLDHGDRQVAGQGTIVIGPAERPERRQWTIAHEIGESVAHRVFTGLGVAAEAEPAERELVANHLASCLLLPRDWFNTDGRNSEWDLFALKTRYSAASHELIARRMLEMPPPIVVTLCDQGRIRWRRTNIGVCPPRLLPQELVAWREAHESGRRASATLDPESTGLESTRAWPIHESHWKREILRSKIAE